jgi:hypothetical protein
MPSGQKQCTNQLGEKRICSQNLSKWSVRNLNVKTSMKENKYIIELFHVKAKSYSQQ